MAKKTKKTKASPKRAATKKPRAAAKTAGAKRQYHCGNCGAPGTARGCGSVHETRKPAKPLCKPRG